jgi:hypothetical protein
LQHHLRQRRETIEFGHVDVEGDDIGREFQVHADGFAAVAGKGHRKATGLLEELAQLLAHEG